MPTTFNVFRLGTFADLDTDDSNRQVEDAGLLEGKSFGSSTDPLYNQIQTFSPGGMAILAEPARIAMTTKEISTSSR
ncbi:hypothetical protein [Paracoccus sp. PARArs4]|uniref:hypothetical protein n=1 Tax=Paracoccus sp. PARArs4 TaxID=2853442 RepID=UPI0024A62436|nr:hypothetical protein [Paracoccus sp. PARArs4]